MIIAGFLACKKKDEVVPNTSTVVNDTLALRQGIYLGSGSPWGGSDTCLVKFIKDSITINFKLVGHDGGSGTFHYEFINIELLKDSIKQKAGNYGLYNGILVKSDSLGIGFQTNLDGSVSMNCVTYNFPPIGQYTFGLDRGTNRFNSSFKLNPTSVIGINH